MAQANGVPSTISDDSMGSQKFVVGTAAPLGDHLMKTAKGLQRLWTKVSREATAYAADHLLTTEGQVDARS